VTKLGNIIYYQSVCKGRTGQVNVLDSKSVGQMASKLDIDLPIAVTLNSKTYNRDEIY